MTLSGWLVGAVGGVPVGRAWPDPARVAARRRPGGWLEPGSAARPAVTGPAATRSCDDPLRVKDRVGVLVRDHAASTVVHHEIGVCRQRWEARGVGGHLF